MEDKPTPVGFIRLRSTGRTPHDHLINISRIESVTAQYGGTWVVTVGEASEDFQTDEAFDSVSARLLAAKDPAAPDKARDKLVDAARWALGMLQIMDPPNPDTRRSYHNGVRTLRDAIKEAK